MIRKTLRREGIFGFILHHSTAIGVLLAIFVVFSTLIFQSQPVQAAQTIPYKVNFQGRLTDASGANKANGQYNMRFRLYSATTGGTASWTETRETTNRVTVTNGLFNVQLGDIAALSPTTFTSYPLFLEVELPTPATATCATASCAVWTEGAMTPRSPLGASPYAFNADTVDGIDGISLARKDAANTFTQANTFNGKTYFSDSVSISQNAPLMFNLTFTGSDYQLQSAGAGSFLYSSVDGLNIGVTNTGGSGASVTQHETLQIRSASTNLSGMVDNGVGYADNLATNPGFEFGCAGWEGCLETSTASPASGLSTMRFSQDSAGDSNDMRSRMIAAAPGDQFYTSVKVKTSATSTGQGGIYVEYLDASGETIDYSNGDWTNPGTSYGLKAWVHTAPAGTAYLKMALTVRGDGSTGGVWDFDEAYVKRINQSSPALFRNDINSTTSFLIQNTSGVNLFVADTANNSIKIGGGDVAPSGDAVLLVLDNKNTIGDPTGVNGATYYNANTNKFRCYEGNVWKDCIGSNPRTTYEYSNEMMFGTSSSGLATSNTNIDGTLVLGISNGSMVSLAGTQNRPGILQFSTSSSAVGTAGLMSGSATQAAINVMFGGGVAWTMQGAVRIPTLTEIGTGQQFTARFGFFNLAATGATPTNGCYFSQSAISTYSGRWAGTCIAGGASTICDTGIMPVANAWSNLELTVNPAGTAATFTVNGVAGCTISSGLPSGGSGFGVSILKTAGTTARTIDVDYLHVKAIGLTR